MTFSGAQFAKLIQRLKGDRLKAVSGMVASAWPGNGGLGLMFEKIDKPNKGLGIVLLVAQVWTQLGFGLDPIAVFEPSGVPKGLDVDFGTGVAISDNWMVIGAPSDFASGAPESGSATVYRRTGANWIEHEKLLGEGWSNERFGWSIAMDGDWLMILGPNHSNFCCTTGRVYAFRRETNGTKNDLSDDSWELLQIINENLERCCMGPIALDGHTLVIGGPGPEFDPDTDAGRAYVFEWNGQVWGERQVIWPSDSRPRDAFGGAVTIKGSWMAIGALFRNSVYIFHRARDGWLEQAQLTGQPGDLFGSSVSFGEDFLLVGAPGHGWQGGVGIAYIFSYNGSQWVEDTRLVPQSSYHVNDAGLMVSACGDSALLGADGPLVGFLFQRTQEHWNLVAQFEGSKVSYPPRVAVHDHFALLRNALFAVGDPFTLSDFGSFQNCMRRDRRLFIGECSVLDFESDRRVDTADFPLFLLTFRGPQ